MINWIENHNKLLVRGIHDGRRIQREDRLSRIVK